MNKFLLALTAAVALPTALIAQTAERSESLFVRNGAGDPVPFTNVSIKGGSSRVTDLNGLVLILGQDDTLNVLIRRMGFEPFQGKIGRSSATGAFNVVIDPTAQALKKKVVTARPGSNALEKNGFYDRMMEVQRGAMTGEFFTPEDLESRSSPRVSQFLSASRYAKVVSFSEGGARGGMIMRPRMMIQGRRNCAMAILQDGVLLRGLTGDSGERSDMFIDDIVNMQSVMAIEVYPNSESAPMSLESKVHGNTCGIVALWTGARR